MACRELASGDVGKACIENEHFVSQADPTFGSRQPVKGAVDITQRDAAKVSDPCRGTRNLRLGACDTQPALSEYLQLLRHDGVDTTICTANGEQDADGGVEWKQAGLAELATRDGCIEAGSYKLGVRLKCPRARCQKGQTERVPGTLASEQRRVGR